MPIFEYFCKHCSHQFEKIVSSADAVTKCPECSSRKIEKQLSTFAVNAKSNAAGPSRELPMSPCGSCGDPRGPGACSLN